MSDCTGRMGPATLLACNASISAVDRRVVVDALRALPRARAERLAARFATTSFIAFVFVGVVIHLLIVRDAPSLQHAKIDGALAAGLLLLYALVLPLAMRTGRAVRAQSLHLEGKTRQLSALLDQLPAVVWATDTELRFTESAGAALKEIGLEAEGIRGAKLQDVVGTDDPEHPWIAAHRRALRGETASYESSF